MRYHLKRRLNSYTIFGGSSWKYMLGVAAWINNLKFRSTLFVILKFFKYSPIFVFHYNWNRLLNRFWSNREILQHFDTKFHLLFSNFQIDLNAMMTILTRSLRCVLSHTPMDSDLESLEAWSKSSISLLRACCK